MRRYLAMAILVGLAVPATADTETSFADANRIFGQVSAGPVVEDIDGEWLPLSALAGLNGSDAAPRMIGDLVDRFCGMEPSRGHIFSASGQVGFSILVPNPRSELVYDFDWTSGSQFTRSVDPDALYARLGLDGMEGERGVQARADALGHAQQNVHVYRPAPDILVIVAPQLTEIYGRCSSG